MKVKEIGDGKEFQQVEPGAYVARCIGLIDCGTQHTTFQGKPRTRRQVLIKWELPTEIMPDGELAGKPYVLGKFYTASLGEKANLRKDLVSWRGKQFTPDELAGFELKLILGKACMLSITRNEKGKAIVDNVMGLPRGTQVPPQISDEQYFDFEEWDGSDDGLNFLSDGMKAILQASDEYKNKGRKTAPREEEPVPDESGEIPAQDDDNKVPF